MNLDKIFEYKDKIQQDLSFEEITKLYREILYNEYEKLTDYDSIHCYQLARSILDIFTQMIVDKREFDEKYLKDKIKW